MSGPHQPVDPTADPALPAPPPQGPWPADAWPTPPPGDAWPPPAPATPPPPRRGSNAGLIVAVIAVVGVALLALCGVGGWFLFDRVGGEDAGPRAQPDRAIEGVKDFRSDDPDALGRDHKAGDISYPMTPPAGGPHNPTWQDCTGKVYPEPVAEEMAVHSLEHGAVWVTYRPGLAAGDVAKLAKKVQGTDYLMLSPYPDLDKPISLQAWGYQLKVDSADDERIDAFIAKYRQQATMEPGAPCSGGTTDSGAPHAAPSPT